MEKYTSENSELVARAIGYIKENKCDPEITVGDVARGAGFSENYFNRVFALHTGFSVMEYVRHERIREWVGDRHDGYSRHLLNLGKL